MKINIILVIMLCLNFQMPALADPTYSQDVPFEIKGFISLFYGRSKSAEANMWEMAFKVCNKLGEDNHRQLILNRLSDVTLKEDSAFSTALATFVCVPVGFGD